MFQTERLTLPHTPTAVTAHQECPHTVLTLAAHGTGSTALLQCPVVTAGGGAPFVDDPTLIMEKPLLMTHAMTMNSLLY